MGLRLLDLPDALRDEGVEPVVVDGFAWRGSDFASTPRLHLVHWTAGPRTGRTPSLRTVTFGRPDLPYNLCQVLQSREGGTKPDKAYCVSSGRAVHAGNGTWANITSGNSRGTGNEIEWSGPGENFPGNRYDTTIRIAAALVRLQGSDAKYVCNHAEYALPEGRKIDTNLDGARLRRDVYSQLRVPEPHPTPVWYEEDDEMQHPLEIVRGSVDGKWYATDGLTRQYIKERSHAAVLVTNFGANIQAAPRRSDGTVVLESMVPFTWPQEVINSIRLVGTAS